MRKSLQFLINRHLFNLKNYFLEFSYDTRHFNSFNLPSIKILNNEYIFCSFKVFSRKANQYFMKSLNARQKMLQLFIAMISLDDGIRKTQRESIQSFIKYHQIKCSMRLESFRNPSLRTVAKIVNEMEKNVK